MTVSPIRRRSFDLMCAAIALVIVALLSTTAANAKKPKAKTSRTSADRAEIDGTVRTAGDDTPLGDVRVRLEGSTGVLEAASAADGSFEVVIPAATGSYTIHLERDGYAPFEAEVELEAGQRYSYNFTLVDAMAGRRQAAAAAYNEGAALYQDGDVAGAKAKFLEAAAANPDLVEAQLGLANVYLREDDLDAARTAVERFRAAQPDEPNGQRIAFEVYLRQGDSEKLATLVDVFRGTEQAASLAAQVYNDGVAAMRSGDNDRAIAFFDLAHGLDPALAEPLTGKATVQYNLEDYAGLEQTLERLDEVSPNHPRSHRLRFLLHDARAENAAALEAFEAYHAVDPEGAIDLLYKRAELDFRDGHAEAARTLLDRILALAPDHARAHFTLGLALASAGDTAGARRHLQRFLELAPDDPEAATAREMLPHLGS